MKAKGYWWGIGFSVVLIIATTVMIFSTVSAAKWTSLGIGSNSVQVAAFAASVAEITTDNLEINCNGGTNEDSYQFSVSNQEKGKTAEVALSYTITVELPAALPDGFSMKIDGVQGTANANKKVYTFEDDDWSFEAGVAKTDIRTLMITADPNKVDFNVQMNAVNVTVTMEQVN